jgi:nicotinamidase-related amidase
MKKALLVIDMQVMPFIWKEYGGREIFQEENLISNINHLKTKARLADNPVFYILYTETGESPRAEGQPLWEIIPNLAPEKKDITVIKYHTDSFFKTNLEASLRQQNINDLVICGIQTEFCVDTTCKSAFSHGFSVELASDGHSTYDSDLLSARQIIAHHNSILTQFARIAPTSDISME